MDKTMFRFGCIIMELVAITGNLASILSAVVAMIGQGAAFFFAVGIQFQQPDREPMVNRPNCGRGAPLGPPNSSGYRPESAYSTASLIILATVQ